MTPPPRDGARASAASASASSPSPHLTVWASVLSGALAACGAVLFTNVPETVKVRLQLDGEGAARGAARQYASLRDAVSKIVRQEGALALQAGLRPALIYQAIMNGCRLGLYEPMQRGVSAAAGGAAPPGSTAAKVLASAASGVVGVVLGNPFFLVKTRLQAASRHFVAREAHDYAGMLDGLAKVARREGLGGFARGLSAAIPRVVAASVTQLVSFDHARELARGPSVGLTGAFPQVIFASALSAVATVTALNPFGAFGGLHACASAEPGGATFFLLSAVSLLSFVNAAHTILAGEGLFDGATFSRVLTRPPPLPFACRCRCDAPLPIRRSGHKVFGADRLRHAYGAQGGLRHLHARVDGQFRAAGAAYSALLFVSGSHAPRFHEHRLYGRQMI